MTAIVNLSNNQDIDGILWGWEWGTGGAQNLTFSFPTSTAVHYDGYVQINGFSCIQRSTSRRRSDSSLPMSPALAI